LEARLSEVSKSRGTSVSAFVRDAVRRACDEAPLGSIDPRFGGLIGSCSSGGGDSRRTGREFTRLMVLKHGRGRNR
jgi:hypothetical protein